MQASEKKVMDSLCNFSCCFDVKRDILSFIKSLREKLPGDTTPTQVVMGKICPTSVARICSPVVVVVGGLAALAVAVHTVTVGGGARAKSIACLNLFTCITHVTSLALGSNFQVSGPCSMFQPRQGQA